jgi:hypothetical protein
MYPSRQSKTPPKGKLPLCWSAILRKTVIIFHTLPGLRTMQFGIGM